MRMANLVPLIGGLTLSAACAASSTVAAPDTTLNAATVISVSPASATVGADPTKPVIISFSHAMMNGMEMLVLVHEGSLTGPAVVGVATWSTDRTMMTFVPSSPLKAHTVYMVHLSPSLKDAAGQAINLAAGMQMGGQYATAGMMGLASGAGMMNGAWGPGMMGSGWKSTDGTFGMFFSFTTA